MLNSFDGRIFLRTGGAKGPRGFTNSMDRFGVGRAASTDELHSSTSVAPSLATHSSRFIDLLIGGGRFGQIY